VTGQYPWNPPPPKNGIYRYWAIAILALLTNQ
jgi:hypothetical protein